MPPPTRTDSQSCGSAAGLVVAFVLPLVLASPLRAQELTAEQVWDALRERADEFVGQRGGADTKALWRAQEGEWQREADGALTYVCDVIAAIIPTTPGEREGRLLTARLTVYYDADERAVKTRRLKTDGTRGWDARKASITEILAQFPDGPVSEVPPRPAVSEISQTEPGAAGAAPMTRSLSTHSTAPPGSRSAGGASEVSR
jgi:hypothetical protein